MSNLHLRKHGFHLSQEESHLQRGHVHRKGQARGEECKEPCRKRDGYKGYQPKYDTGEQANDGRYQPNEQTKP